MFFSMRVKGYQRIMDVFKILGKYVPMPKPTLFSGPGSSLELCKAIAQMGNKKVLIVTDAMLVKIGLLNDVQKTLKDNGVSFVIYDGVQPDPTYDQVEDGLKVFKKNHCESILAFGGGSSIDAAKVIAARATNDKPIKKLAGIMKVWIPPVPLYAIPTTAGTGSEVTVAAVVSDPVTHQKTPVIDPKIVPMAAALDGALMTGLPPTITSATGMDALTHAVEAYISVNAMIDTDGYAIAATRLIMENLPICVKDGKNVEARQNMALASYYAGLAFTKASLGYVHAISHNFGALYHTPHGLGNAIVLPYILEYSKEAAADRLAELAEVCNIGSKGGSKSQKAQQFIDHIRRMLKEFNIPEKLAALQKQDIPKIAKAALKEAHYNYPVPKYMDQSTCEEILHKMVA